jgi:hypothetical protein
MNKGNSYVKRENGIVKVSVPARRENNTIQVRPSADIQEALRTVTIAGETRSVDPQQLVRLIRRVTQTIGEYTGRDDIYSAIIAKALREARGELVTVLEDSFGVHWRIENGKSVFWR